MKVLFTRSDKAVSRLIQRVTDEPVSHVVIEASDYIIHSNFLGVHAEPKETFKPEIIYSVEVPDNHKRLLGLFIKRRGSWYDFGALLYLGVKCLIPWLPKKNLWACSGMYLCTEWVTEFLDDEADSMITPYQLYLRLSNKALVDS